MGSALRSAWRNSLAYPAGVAPGFDPTHPAAGTRTFISTVNLAGHPVNVLTGQTGTDGDASSYGISAFGPYQYGTLANPYVQFPIAPTLTTFLAAAIFTPITVGGGYQTLIGDLSSDLYIKAGVPLFYSAGDISSGLPAVVANQTYFMAASGNFDGLARTVNFVLQNLNTGSVLTAATSVTRSAFSLSYTRVGASGASEPSLSYIYSTMLSDRYASIPELRQWAADPWSFWYPSQNDNWNLDAMVAAAVAASNADIIHGGFGTRIIH